MTGINGTKGGSSIAGGSVGGLFVGGRVDAFFAGRSSGLGVRTMGGLVTGFLLTGINGTKGGNVGGSVGGTSVGGCVDGISIGGSVKTGSFGVFKRTTGGVGGGIIVRTIGGFGFSGWQHL